MFYILFFSSIKIIAFCKKPARCAGFKIYQRACF